VGAKTIFLERSLCRRHLRHRDDIEGDAGQMGRLAHFAQQADMPTSKRKVRKGPIPEVGFLAAPSAADG
jgi:hypothetical protein